MNSFSRTAPGKDLFTWVMYYNYWFITAAGATFFATAITEEKEERTLGLMKMAGVGAAAVLAGKWIPRLIGALLLILIQIPFTVLAITLGGVLWQQIGAAYLALLAHLFFVGNIGLLASVTRPTMSGASGLSVVILFLFHVLPFVLKSALTSFTPASMWSLKLSNALVIGSDSAVEMCAMWRLGAIMGTGFNESWFSFQVVSNLIAGAVLLFFSWLLFEPCTRNDVEPGEATWLNKVRHFGAIGNSRRSWEAALIWKDFHYLAGGVVVLLVKCVAYALVVIGFALMFSDWDLSDLDNEVLGWTCWITGILMLILESSVIATRVYREEMTKNTWSLLSMLPMSLPSVAYSKLVGSTLGLLPVCGCLLMSLLLIPDDLLHGLGDILTDAQAFLIVSYFITQVLLGIHLATYLSITSRWAVWPLAIFMGGFIIIMGNVMIFSCLSGMGSNDGEGLMFLMCCVSSVMIVTLHILLGRRLSVMGSE